MKFGDRKLDKPNVAYAVIPRPPLREKQEDGNIKEINQDIVFTAEAVLDFTPFEKLCPEPKPQPGQRPGGEVFVNINDPKYKAKIMEWAGYKHSWVVIESLKATKELTWDTVDPNIPSTWKNYEQELRDAKFTSREMNEILKAVVQANALDDDRIKEARDRFLSSLSDNKPSGLPSPTDEQSNSKNGELVNV